MGWRGRGRRSGSGAGDPDARAEAEAAEAEAAGLAPALETVASVLPTAVPIEGPFGHTIGVLNRFEIDAEPLGRVSFGGPGAGGAVTSSAVLGDLHRPGARPRQYLGRPARGSGRTARRTDPPLAAPTPAGRRRSRLVRVPAGRPTTPRPRGRGGSLCGRDAPAASPSGRGPRRWPSCGRRSRSSSGENAHVTLYPIDE